MAAECFVGIDIGSITAKCVVLTNGGIASRSITPTGVGGPEVAQNIVQQALDSIGGKWDDIAYIVATGYGRISVPFECKKVTEITCHGRGVHHLFPAARLVVDIGGQDSKVIKLDDRGQVVDFVMNDKCAAGTGRFLEVIANAMQVDIGQLGDLSLQSDNVVDISSTCTVFAESEVVSLVARGTPRVDIIAGVHRSIASRVYGMVKGKLDEGVRGDIILTGGVAKNSGVLRALEEKLGRRILVPEEPQYTGALGAAIISLKQAGKTL
jgi:predicted CoA-substrate-specific enzyme activase